MTTTKIDDDAIAAHPASPFCAGALDSRAWRIATAVGAVGLAAYFIAILSFRMAGAWGEYSLDGDHAQAVWQYWRYHIDGALPPGHLQTDYAFVMHAQPGWWAMMASLSTFVQPLTAAKILEIVSLALYLGVAVYLVGRRTHPLLGIAMGFLVMRSPDIASTIAGGYARSFGPFLLVAFLGAFLFSRHRLCLALLVLQAALYPSVVISCGIAYGVYCLVKGPTMRDRVRRCAGMFVAGLLVIAFGEFQELAAPKWWGSPVTYAEAQTMPAWGPGGRFPDVPHRPALGILAANIERGHKELGHILAPAAAHELVASHVKMTLIAPPLALAAGILLVQRIRQRRRGGVPDDDERFPWQVPALFVAAIAGYWLTRALAFKLYLPSRQLGHTVQYLVMTGMVLIVWCAARAVFGRRRVAALLVTTMLTVVPAFIFRGDGLAVDSFHYANHERARPMFEAIRKLPLDAIIACDTYWCDVMGVFTYHRAYATRNLTHPIRKGYYQEAERRLVEMHKALFATSWDDLKAFAAREHVDYFVYTMNKVRKPESRIYKPATDLVRKAWEQANARGPMVLLAPPPEAVVFRKGEDLIVDLRKLP